MVRGCPRRKNTGQQPMSDTREICVRIWGGLGNQMFQYAAGYALAKHLGVELLVDPVEMAQEHTTFGLGLFNLETKVWRPVGARAVARRMLSGLRGKETRKKLERLWPGRVYRPGNFCSADDFGTIGPGTYLNGYFQSEQFFVERAEEIRALYSLDHIVPSIDGALRQAAADPGSVSVHIRRGDYAREAKVTEVHGLLADDYYSRAYEIMRALVPDCRFLVFSDDLAAADELTRRWRNHTLVQGHTREQDLYLMSACANHVIANSSFSWWGAWLGRNPGKQVIAPRRWFSRAEMKKVYVDDVCPVGWILI